MYFTEFSIEFFLGVIGLYSKLVSIVTGSEGTIVSCHPIPFTLAVFAEMHSRASDTSIPLMP